MKPNERSLSELRQLYWHEGKEASSATLKALEADNREGAKALAHAIAKRREAARAEAQRLERMWKYEAELVREGFSCIAGVDEAGMAPLAGPVVAAAAILPPNYRLPGLDDSKKVALPEAREALADRIKADAVAWATGTATPEEIDTLNIYHAGLLAMRRAVEGLAVAPDFCLVDARRIPDIAQAQRGIIRGDSLSLSIAAASILAKTTRDAHLAELDAQFPGYGLKAHKGYPTPEHLNALKRLGAAPIHRKSFAPVREVLGLVPQQVELFKGAVAAGASASARKPARGASTSPSRRG